MNRLHTALVPLAVFAALTVAAASPANAQQSRHAVLLPASGINVHEGYLEASQDLLVGHLLSTGAFEVTVLEGPPRRREIAPDEAVARAREHGAQLAIVLHVTRLGSTARLRVAAYESGSGQAVHRDELPVDTPDDIDRAIERMAKGLATGKPASETADIGTVTARESDPLRKRTATNVFGLKLGFVTPQNRADMGEPIIPGGAVFWLYDVRTFLAEVDVGFHAKDGDGDFTLGIGSYYPLSKQNVTPYIGGGVQWNWANYGGDGASGLTLLARGGVLIGRLSSVQIRGDLSYFLNTFAERHSTGVDGSTVERHAHGLTANLGIGF